MVSEFLHLKRIVFVFYPFLNCKLGSNKQPFVQKNNPLVFVMHSQVLCSIMGLHKLCYEGDHGTSRFLTIVLSCCIQELILGIFGTDAFQNVVIYAYVI
jgi:hypothetical protein